MQEFNKDQFDALSRLSLDIARAAFVLALIPTTQTIKSDEIFINLFKMAIDLFLGIAFTYIGMVILKRKENLKKWT
mgnify:CR=1 FL=1